MASIERKNLYPKPPGRILIGDLKDGQRAIDEIIKHLANVARYTQYRQDSLLDVLSDDIESMSVNKLTAGTLDVDKVYIGGTPFELDGLLTQLRIKDQQATPVIRVEMGLFGAGVDAGIKVRNDAGTVVFQAASTTFIDGAFIKAATITNAAILDATITNAKISSLSADKMTLAGTLTCTTTGTAINVTDGGIITFSDGGDLIFKSTASDSTFIKLQNSTGVDKCYMGYNPSTDISSIQSQGTSDLLLTAQPTQKLILGNHATLSTVQILGLHDGPIKPKTTDAEDFGDVIRYWRDLYLSRDVKVKPGNTCKIDGNVTLGGGVTDIMKFTCVLDSSLRLKQDSTWSSGESAFAWLNVYSDNFPTPSHSSLKMNIRDIPEDIVIPRGVFFEWKNNPGKTMVGYLSDSLPQEAFDMVDDETNTWTDIKSVIGVLCTVARKQENRINKLQEKIKTLESLLDSL